MKEIVHHKIIDKSVLTDGMTLPRESIALIYGLIGKELERGESEPITMIIDNEQFVHKDDNRITITNLNNSSDSRTNDSLQFRYNKSSVGEKLRHVFSESVSKVIGSKEVKKKNSKGEEKVILQEAALSNKGLIDYINIYSTDSHTFIIDCHMKLNDTDYILCKDNFDYLVAAKTKPFLILGGFSGTGKSQKVKELAYLTCPDVDDLQKGQDPGNYCLISVKPNWHDSTELLGYYSNIGKKYIVTEFIKFLVKAMKYPLVPFYVCIDEMNLAPVEEYFAEYLSVLESRKVVDGQVVSGALVSKDVFMEDVIFADLGATDDNIKKDLKENGLRLPQNIIVIGTVNMDDTTNSFSRKVIDRAMTFETKIEDILTESYFSLDNDALTYKNITCPERFICDQVRVADLLGEDTPDFKLSTEEKENQKAFTEFINEVNKAIGNGKGYANKDGLGVSPFQVSYRVLNEAVLYYRSLKVLYPEQASFDKVFNDILMMKILPRIEGEQDRAKAPLEGLQQLVSLRMGDDENKKALWKESAEKIAYMLRPFQKGGDGFTTFWQ